MEYTASLMHLFLIYTFGVSRCTVSAQRREFDPCSDYSYLPDAERRLPTEGPGSALCDASLDGWYAIRAIGGEPAIIPTQCLQVGTCGTTLPLRVDLDGQRMPEAGQNITAYLCGTSYNALGKIDCCVRRKQITIIKCSGSLTVYHLPKQDGCPVAVCVQKENEAIPEELLAKDGDIPRLPPSTTVTTTAPTTPPFQIVCPEGLSKCPDDSCHSECPSTTSAVPTSTELEINKPLAQITSSSSSTSTPTTTVPPPPPTSPSRLEPLNSTTSPEQDLTNSTTFPSAENSTASEEAVNTTSTQPSSNITESATSQNQTVPDTSAADGLSVSTESAVTSTEGEKTNATVPLITHASLPGEDDFTQALNATTSTEDAGSGDADQFSVMPSAGPTTVKISDSAFTSTSSPSTTSASAPTELAASPDVLVTMTTTSVRPSETMTTTEAPVKPEGVRIVLKGNFEEPVFSRSLRSFVDSRLLSNVTEDDWASFSFTTASNVTVDELGERNFTIVGNTTVRNFTIFAKTFFGKDDITIAEVFIINPKTGSLIAADKLTEALKTSYPELDLPSDLELLDICPISERCGESYIPGASHSRGGDSTSLFEQNRAAFIAIIVVAALLPVVALLVVLCKRRSKSGTWVLADHEEKCGVNQHLAIESPMTDSQIKSEENVTPLITNGVQSPTPDSDIPAADEDNGWVVPLEQAVTGSGGGVAKVTEDTHL